MKQQKKSPVDGKSKAAGEKGEAPMAPAVGKVMDELKDKARKARKSKGVFRTNEKRVVQAKYLFTPEEKVEMAGKMSQRQLELVEKEDEKKTVMAGFADQLKRIKLDISKLSRGYRDGYEHRDFNVTPIYDYKAREIRYEDIGTGKVVLTEPFAPGDDQRRFL